jgi:plasmid replication initiation protein
LPIKGRFEAIKGAFEVEIMKKSDLVVTSNKYVEAKYTLGLNEEKVIYCAMLTAREIRTGYDHETFVEVRASDYAELTGLDMKEAYQAMRRTASSLKRRFVIFQEPDPVTGLPSELEVPLVTGIRYVADAGVLRLRFTKEIIPHFTQLVDGHFTSHEIGYLAKLSSVYATRLYRLLHKELWKNKTIEFDFEYLREVFQIGGKYRAIKDFKVRVIDLAITQINEHTELTVSYENIKLGRTVVGLEFTVKEKASVVVEAPKKQKTKPTAPNKSISAFSGLERQIFMKLQHDFDFMTEEYVRSIMDKWGLDDAVIAMHKLRKELSPEYFTLEKTD